MREIDQLGIVNSDPFILISGDVISNMDLKRAIEFHKAKRKEDNDCVMTVVMKPIQKMAGVKPTINDLVVAMDKRNNQILYFEDNYNDESIGFPVEILKSHNLLEVSSTLMDCHIDVCSPEFLLQFSDNFDYHDIRRQFIQNEAVNWELGMHIFGYVLGEEYAARVHDPRTYHYICRDIINRWVFPLVPDSLLLPDNSYVHTGKYVYKESGVKIARSARIGAGVVIGRGTVIEENVVLEKTIVGRYCVIKANSLIKDSHLWSRTVINENVCIYSSIVCDNCEVLCNSIVPRGSILSFGVIVGNDVTLPEFTRLSRKIWNAETRNADACDKNFDCELLGANGEGFVWRTLGSEVTGGCEDSESEDSVREYESKEKLDLEKLASIGYTEGLIWKESLRSNTEFELSDEDDSDNEEDFDFEKNVGDTLITGYKQGHSEDDVLMEVKSIKFAHNKEFSDCISGVMPAILEIILDGAKCMEKGSEMVKIMTSAKKNLNKSKGWGYGILRPLLQENIDGIVLIESLEKEALVDGSPYYGLFRMMLQVLHESELLTEEILGCWISDKRLEENQSRRKLFNEPSVQEFVDWLQNDGNSEDDDDDDDTDDDDDGG